MKRKKYLLFIILTIVSGLVGGAISNYVFMARPAVAQESSVSPGLEPYTPMKIEWLEVVLNSQFRDDTLWVSENGYMLNFFYDGPDTIVIVCLYKPEADPMFIRLAIENVKTAVKQYIELHKWNWVKIKEDVRIIKD